ncbi:MAG: hypothetical protein R3D68_15565 [Hyphomicrobiaceae bacterium]
MAAERGPDDQPAQVPIKGLRNLFGPASPEQLFTANDRMASPFEVPQSVRILMRRLAFAMNTSPGWSDILPGAVRSDENPSLPSGYTYLLQLMAHDLVESALSLASTDGSRFGFSNARRLPLGLETIYGGGPHLCPYAYEISAEHMRAPGLIPRTRFRLGRIDAPGAIMPDTDCSPFRDLGRGRPIGTSDEALLTPPKGADGSSRPFPLTEAFVADPRNDDHAIISQLTVLFQSFHNRIESLLKAAQDKLQDGVGKPAEPDNLAYLRFTCAQLAIVHVYRGIIVNDVLRRIMHPRVFAYYAAAHFEPADSLGGVALEFTHGAFRFGHAMVRQSYLVNNDTQQPLGRALEQSSQRSASFLPVSNRWIVDWRRFFPEPDQKVPAYNLSHRIRPRYATVLGDEALFPRLDAAVDAAGLACRDLVSSCYAGLWSVPMLFGELRRGPLRDLLPDFTDWHGPLRGWLEDSTSRAAEKLTDEDIGDLIADPPMPFFILLEAALTDERAVVSRSGEGGGRHLGPLGSIIVGETILGALRDNPIGFEDAGPALDLRLRKLGSDLIGDPGVLEPLAALRTMPDVVRFLGSSGGVAAGDPG